MGVHKRVDLGKMLRLPSRTKKTVRNQNKVSESITTGVLKARFDCFVISLNLSGKKDSSLSELSQGGGEYMNAAVSPKDPSLVQ